MEKLIIIIPAHNEEKRIKRTLDNYLSFFSKLKKEKLADFEIIVVLNACKDNTMLIVKKYKNKELKILNFKQGGKGFAVVEGFKDALKSDSDFIGFVDADMATSPESFYDLLKNIKNYDGIIASRYIKGSVVSPKPSLQRMIVSRIFNVLVRAVFLMKYRDTQCGAKIFRKAAIEQIISKLSLANWAFDVDLLYQMKKKKLKIREFPTTWSDQKYSKINFAKAGPNMGLAIIRLKLLDSRLKNFVKIYDKLNRLKENLKNQKKSEKPLSLTTH